MSTWRETCFGADETFSQYEWFWTVEGFIANYFWNGYHPFFPWFSFILFGMWLGKSELHCQATQMKLIVGGLSVALSVEVLSALLVPQGEFVAYFVDTKPMPPTVFYVVAAMGWASAIIGLCCYVSAKWPRHPVIDRLQQTGQLALSHYVFHSAIVLTIVSWLGLLHEQTGRTVLLFCLFIYAMMIVFSIVWRKRYERGPLEWLMRKVTR